MLRIRIHILSHWFRMPVYNFKVHLYGRAIRIRDIYNLYEKFYRISQ